MKENICKAFAEVNDILLHSEKEIQEKIPNNIKELIKNNIDTNYRIEIDYSKSINEQKLLNETRDILVMIYRDYLCSEQERKEIIEKNNQYKKEIEERYDITKFFEQRKQKNVSDIGDNLPIEVKEPKWYKRLFDWIKRRIRKK